MATNIIVHGGWLNETFFIWGERPPSSRFDQIVNFQYPFLYSPFELKLRLFQFDQISYFGTFVETDKAIIDVPIKSRVYQSLAGEITVYQAQESMTQYSFPLEGLVLSIEELVSYFPLLQSWKKESQLELAPDLVKWMDLFETIQQFIIEGCFSPTASGQWHIENFPYDSWLEYIPLSGRMVRENTSYIQHQSKTITAASDLENLVIQLCDTMVRSILQKPSVHKAYVDWQLSINETFQPLIEKLNESGKVDSALTTKRFQQKIGLLQSKPFLSGLALQEPETKDGLWKVSLCMVDRKQPSLMVNMDQLEKGEHPWRENPIAQLKIDLKKAQDELDVLRPLRISAPTLSLQSDEAYDLFTNSDDELEQAGFHLIVPKWMTEKKKPRVKLNMNELNTKSASSEPLLDWQSVASFTYDLALGDQKISKKEFEEFVDGKRPFLYANGEWMSWDRSLADKLLDYLERIEQGTSFLEAWRLDQLDDEDDFETDIDIDVTWGEELTKSIQELYTSSPTLIDIPDTLNGELRPYQQEGVSWLAHLRRTGFGGCLADDMGLGKSIQTIAICSMSTIANKKLVKVKNRSYSSVRHLFYTIGYKSVNSLPLH
ncbi:helicase [Halalkalibacter wakoensis JCM 9140]|uniref:Helicase n=1 Tax=Halalkalibacter wakoensis JCM 9140 TaxID=1236970 RepID=W4Q1I2_9BACI|nr:helicase [Halalkalibacter wakoensis JCM 9140]